MPVERSGAWMLPLPKMYKRLPRARRDIQVMGWTGAGLLVFQFTGYPLLCRTIGIVPLLRITGVIGTMLRSGVPYIQRSAWSRRHSYPVSISLLVLVDICGSVVSYER